MDDDKLLKQLRNEFETGFEIKKGRFESWGKIEDQYYGKTEKQLKTRFNVPLPIMSGFLNTLTSKIDNPPAIEYSEESEADYRSVLKINSFINNWKNKDDYDWDMVDLDGKKLASFYGRGIFKTYGIYNKMFQFVFNCVDPYDFYIDPNAGANMENAGFMGENNIIKTGWEIEKGVEQGLYDKNAAEKLINGGTEEIEIDDETTENSKERRLFSLNILNKSYVASGAHRLVESGTVYDGERMYVLWSYEKNCILRKKQLKKMFSSGLWWWTSWATYRDSFNFWSMSPADEMYPIADIMKILANQELDNRQKSNWGMRAFDPAVYPNKSELRFRPDGLIATKNGASQVQPIGNGIYEFKTPQLRGTIDLVNWFDDMIGEKTGITAAAQGSSSEEKVGIHYSNLQQVADRLGMFNISYSKCWKAVGRRFLWGCKDNLKTAEAVKIIGAEGVEWDELNKKDINPDLEIKVKDKNAELQSDEVAKKRQVEVLSSIEANPTQSARVNPTWMIEQKLENAGFNSEQIRQATDVEYYGNKELLAKAAEAIDEIIRGGNPKKVRNANVAFIQKILDFADKNTDEDKELFDKLIAYADLHYEEAIMAMQRKAQQYGSSLNQGVMAQGGDQPNFETEGALPNTMEGTQSRSAKIGAV